MKIQQKIPLNNFLKIIFFFILCYLIFSTYFSFNNQSRSNIAIAQENEKFNKDTTPDPEPDVFVPCDHEPEVNLEELAKNVVYPDELRKEGIEGYVIIHLLVTETGFVKKTLVEQSDNELFIQAAIAAIKKTKWEPAIQKGQNIKCWISVPIKFKLKNED